MKFHCTPKIRVTNYIIPQVQIEKCNSYRFPQELQINSLINFHTMWYICFNGHVDPYQIEDFKPKVTTFTRKESFFLSSYILFWDLEINVTRMCITNTFQIKILPKYWNIFLFFDEWCSLVLWDRLLNPSLMFSMFIRECPCDQHVWNQEGRSRVEQREKSS